MKKLASVMMLTVIGTAGLLGACHREAAVTAESFVPGINQHLAQKGELCLQKTQWPVYVPKAETTTNNAVQMPVLEQLGLVTDQDETVTLQSSDGKQVIHTEARRYDLSDEGKKYYVAKPVVATAASGSKQADKPQSDLCVVKLTLDHVTGWTPPVKQGSTDTTTVSYTYRVQAAPWVHDPRLQKVFPFLAIIVNNPEKFELKQNFVRKDKGWELSDQI